MTYPNSSRNFNGSRKNPVSPIAQEIARSRTLLKKWMNDPEAWLDRFGDVFQVLNMGKNTITARNSELIVAPGQSGKDLAFQLMRVELVEMEQLEIVETNYTTLFGFGYATNLNGLGLPAEGQRTRVVLQTHYNKPSPSNKMVWDATLAANSEFSATCAANGSFEGECEVLATRIIPVIQSTKGDTIVDERVLYISVYGDPNSDTGFHQIRQRHMAIASEERAAKEALEQEYQEFLAQKAKKANRPVRASRKTEPTAVPATVEEGVPVS
jgi:hypothetical protein